MKKIFVMNIGTELGGIEKSLIEFLKFLVKEDCQIDLALWKKRGPLFKEIPEGINIIENMGPGSFSDAKKKGIGGFLYYLKFKIFGLFNRAWKSVPKTDGHYDIAISYCHNGYSPYYVIDKVNADKKFIWFHHGSYDGNQRKKSLDDKYYQKYDRIVTVSESNRKMLSELFNGIQIEVIPNIIDEEKIRQMSNEDIDAFNGFEGLKIATVGRFSKEKGHLFSLEIAKELKEKGVSFKWVFIGDGEEKERCIQKQKEYDLVECCDFVGAKTNPYPYIKQADLYIQTSFVESEGLTIKEALVLGKKIIVLKLPALQEILEFGKYGHLCEHDLQEILDKILSFCNTITEGLIFGEERVNELNCITKKRLLDLIIK